jgi:NAD(P)-dependent dehydrogenase (short-subunit alcohol dehydrogenase family)
MDRVAVVTGATRNLGLALVEGLAQRLRPDDIVYLTSRDPARVSDALATIEAPRAQLRGEALDVADAGAVARFASALSERHGGVDVVFSNAYHRVGPEDDPAASVERYAAVNNLGTTNMLRAFAPLLREHARLLVVASTLGTLHYLAPVLHPHFDEPKTLDELDVAVRSWRDAVRDRRRAAEEAWPAFINIPSKIAQVAAVRVLARERREDDLRHDVLVASVCPGMIDTGASRPWFDDMSRAQTPREAAVALLDLALAVPADRSFYGELVRFGRVLPWRP